MASVLGGLSEAEVRERVERGEVNDIPAAPSRTVREIVRANVLTRFNALLGGLLVVILIVGPIQDALFGGVLIANALVGILQELRAKRTLDRLAVLTAPRARALREGVVRELPVSQVVKDDVLELQPGDQIVVDGEVLEARGLEVDESLLSGESEPVEKGPGDEVLSGSFVSAGSGRYRATRVGRAAYAVRLAEEARRFTLTRSELRAGIDRILQIVTWAIVPTGVLLLISQLRASASVRGALRGAVAGTVAMVPEGLVLLTSVACSSRSSRRSRCSHASTRSASTRRARSPRAGSSSRRCRSCRRAHATTRRSPPWPRPTRIRTPPCARSGRSSPGRPAVGSRRPRSRSRPRESGAPAPSARTAPGCSALRRCSSGLRAGPAVTRRRHRPPGTARRSSRRPRRWPAPAAGRARARRARRARRSSSGGRRHAARLLRAAGGLGQGGLRRPPADGGRD